eukprot:Plantae.Rhodophyta-Purpureofilum_apyrenoidigerum.ctg10281.p1 GENE.Plantae.Rhodophyta-Purpureofilum_apyrenoidigerum.ctg10281~~Plantae.Rhodophyta-Purpureofilum_apyrenoidigerum.ctg10281.p1  ORF type:complete len:443 (+),score=84.04 Plantae.Rhodophyta-Purpureofilum_apyrenoidigerum.ctg10281:211-1539(+)
MSSCMSGLAALLSRRLVCVEVRTLNRSLSSKGPSDKGAEDEKRGDKSSTVQKDKEDTGDKKENLGAKQREPAQQEKSPGGNKAQKLHERLRQTQAMQREQKLKSETEKLPSDLLREANKVGSTTASDLAAWSEALFGNKSNEKTGEDKSKSFVDPLMYLGQSELVEEEPRGPPDHPMFADELTKDVIPEELEQMITVYELLTKHQKELDMDAGSFKIHHSPLFDEMDFPVSRLPRLPQEILEAYKRDITEERTDEVPFLGSKLNALERNETLPEDFRVWNKVDLSTADADTQYRVTMRTPQEERPDQIAQNHLLNPDPIPESEPVCRLHQHFGDVPLDIDFRHVGILNEFISETGQIMSRRETKLCGAAQKKITKAIKNARYMALLDTKSKVPIPPIPDLEGKEILMRATQEINEDVGTRQKEANRKKQQKYRAQKQAAARK